VPVLIVVMHNKKEAQHEVQHGHTHTHTTVLQPFFWDYLGEPVPEEIFFCTSWCKAR